MLLIGRLCAPGTGTAKGISMCLNLVPQSPTWLGLPKTSFLCVLQILWIQQCVEGLCPSGDLHHMLFSLASAVSVRFPLHQIFILPGLSLHSSELC